MKNKYIKKALSIIAIVLALIAAIYLWIFSYIFFLNPAITDYSQRIHFDSIIWQDPKSERAWDNPVRLRMVNDLLKKHPLVGMSKIQVNKLLGIPKQTGYFRGYDYVYWLGPERGFISIDSEWLGIKFKDNNVIEARILRD